MNDFKLGDKVFDIRYGWGVVGDAGFTLQVFVMFLTKSVYYGSEQLVLLQKHEYELKPVG